jgi:hypothetical protein
MRLVSRSTDHHPRGGIAIAVACCALAVACGSSDMDKGPAKPEAQLLGLEIVGETSVERYDLNGDGKPDLFKIYVIREGDGDKKTLLGRQDLDLDFDGDVDVRRYFNEQGTVVREEMDLDFDGQFDAIDYYSDGNLYRRDMALNFEGKPSIIKYYSANKLTRKERDTNADGKIDTVEFFEDGKLIRTGYDRDGDEKPDVYKEEGQQGGGDVP